MNKAAELKRFRLHPLSSADTRDEQEESGASITEELNAQFKTMHAKTNRLDIIIPTDPLASTKPHAVTETPAVGRRPNSTNAKK